MPFPLCQLFSSIVATRQLKPGTPCLSSLLLVTISLLISNAGLTISRALSPPIPFPNKKFNLSFCSLDTIGLAGFSYDFGALDINKPQHPLARTLDGFTDSSGTHSFSAFLVHSLLWAFPSILRIPSARQKALSKSRHMLAEITNQVWSERKSSGQDNQSSGKSILDLLSKAEKSGATTNLSEEQIAAEVGFIITSSNVHMYLIYLLLDDDPHIRRIRNYSHDNGLGAP